MGALDGVKIVEGEGQVWVNLESPIVTRPNEIPLCREGWRRGSSQMALGRT